MVIVFLCWKFSSQNSSNFVYGGAWCVYVGEIVLFLYCFLFYFLGMRQKEVKNSQRKLNANLFLPKKSQVNTIVFCHVPMKQKVFLLMTSTITCIQIANAFFLQIFADWWSWIFFLHSCQCKVYIDFSG